jgi:hypothetical protein
MNERHATEDTLMTDFGEILLKNMPPRFNATQWLTARQDFGGGRGLRVHGGAGRRCRAPPEAMASTIAWYVDSVTTERSKRLSDSHFLLGLFVYVVAVRN